MVRSAACEDGAGKAFLVQNYDLPILYPHRGACRAAIGRIRRYPQTATVRVYRLYAAASVEEGLYNGGYAPSSEQQPEAHHGVT